MVGGIEITPTNYSYANLNLTNYRKKLLILSVTGFYEKYTMHFIVVIIINN
jgi:hypothetical protein